MTNSEQTPNISPKRLCSEIQLFDLCELESCKLKNGRYCTDADLLASFEKIADEELRAPERYISEEVDESDVEDDGYDDADLLSLNSLEDEDEYGWDEEE